MKMCLVMILVMKVFIFSKTMIICLLCPLLCGLFFFWKGAKGELSYKVKKEQRKSCCSYGYVATNDATIVFILFQIFVNCINRCRLVFHIKMYGIMCIHSLSKLNFKIFYIMTLQKFKVSCSN